ncbi:MAG: hypothetical protein IPM92_16680 [Saprospiraceae bacterium]|nr:hypothetical protein [Saprospiraceae bacterium]
MQIKNLCPRYAEHFSDIRIVRSAGCCDPISNIKLFQNTGSAVSFSFTDPTAVALYTALLKKSGTSQWDTFYFNRDHPY